MTIFLFGFLMGLVDLVPGISGGTVAFLLGILNPLMESLSKIDRAFFKLLRERKFRLAYERINGSFFFLLLLGIASSLLLFAGLMEKVLNHPASRSWLFSFFAGSLLYSSFFMGKRVSRWNLSSFMALFLGIALALFLSGESQTKGTKFYNVPYGKTHFQALPDKVENYDQEKELLLNVPESELAAMQKKGFIKKEAAVFHQGEGKWVALHELAFKKEAFLEWTLRHLGYSALGTLASMAMLLPGISGSSLLLCLGFYFEILGAVSEWMQTFHLAPMFILLFFGIGVLLGFSLVSRVFLFFFRKFPDAFTAALLGMVVGSLPKLWPFWSYSWFLIPAKLEKGVRLQLIAPLFPTLAESVLGISIVAGAAFILRTLEQQSRRQEEGKGK